MLKKHLFWPYNYQGFICHKSFNSKKQQYKTNYRAFKLKINRLKSCDKIVQPKEEFKILLNTSIGIISFKKTVYSG